MPSPSLSGSGQPSSSWKPSLSSGSSGHLSAASGMPSPSLSGSGHPSSSWKPSLSSGSLGHLSCASGIPSPSLSRSGQPSSSWKPSLSSGSFGHLSAAPRMPSWSGSSSTGGGWGAGVRPNSLCIVSSASKSAVNPLSLLLGGNSSRTSARRPQPLSTRYLMPPPTYSMPSVSLAIC